MSVLDAIPNDAVAEQVFCSHCSLPVPAGLIEPGAAQQFCCGGCRVVYQLIQQHDLGDYYRMREKLGEQIEPAREVDPGYAAFDDRAFTERYVRSQPDGSLSTELYLEGVTCAACVWLIENLPRILPDVVSARLDFGRHMVHLNWREGTRLGQIASTLHRLGYPPHPAGNSAARRAERATERRLLIDIAVAAVCAGNAMLLALALYCGLFDEMAAEFNALFRWTSLLFGTVALLWPGRVFLRGAWAALRTRTPHLDIPISVGLLAAGVAGVVNTIAGRGEIFFDSLTVLVFLLLVGRWVQRRQQRWVADALDLLFSLAPTSARKVSAQATVEVPVDSLEAGDVVEVRAGESFPVDGTIASGRSHVDLSLLTGEPQPVEVQAGERVTAGSVNLSDVLQVRVEATGAQTRVGKLMQLVEELARRKAPWVMFADRLAGVFVQVVIALALLTMAIWWSTGWGTAVDHAVALLIVACPCALSLATPLTLAGAIGRAAGRGILVKGGDTLERLAKPGLILFDKTGTLTRGALRLTEWTGEDEIRPLVVALERSSAHPLARAFCEAWGAHDLDYEAGEVRQLSAGGIRGVVAGRDVLVGSPAFVADQLGQPVRAPSRGRATPVHVAIDGVFAGQAFFADSIRPEAGEVIDQVRAAGWQVGIVSGDHHQAVAEVARQLDIAADHCHAGVAPEEKVEIVKASQPGTVVMVGDGVNDAAALSAATVGIAVSGGAEASLAAADVFLRDHGLWPLGELLRASRRSVSALRRGLGASLGYNALAVGSAMLGLIHPLLAAVLMPISSLTVLGMALTARTFTTRTEAG